MVSGQFGMPENGAAARPVGRRLFAAGMAGAFAAAVLPGTRAQAAEGSGSAVAARPGGGGVRHIALSGAVNVRDLGGYRTAHGRTLRWGRVFRADALNKVTDGDLGTLRGLGIRTVVDFRGAPEIAKDGSDRIPAGAALVLNPVLDAAGATMAEAIGRALATGDLAYLDELLGNGKAAALMMDGQRSMVTSEPGRAGFGDTLRRIASKDETPLLYHCTAGKDRTGWMSALVLTALDVPDETIIADYMLSNEYRKASNEATYAFLSSRGIDPALIRPLMEQSPEYIEESLATMRGAYGSVENYIRTGLGLSPSTVGHLRARLLD
ncbi:tyrosine-protein phosphatase [Uniformispora flossi]|uniref:tyrosine-protein phosphatase n=1 Tax=Uniformispora flossi TaxID=3390723 RepID=UPI003C30A828